MIVDGRTFGCWWDPGTPGTRRRTKPIRGVVWHWTAGAGAPKAVYRTLVNRGLSIHYVIGADGAIVQMADPATTVCSHAGSRANGGSIGIEIVNPGVPGPKSKDRAPIDVTIRGRKVRAVDFHSAQYEAVIGLAEHLSTTYGITRAVPANTRTFSPSELAKFHGHLEHLHVSPRKIDSGGLIAGMLAERVGWSIVP